MTSHDISVSAPAPIKRTGKVELNPGDTPVSPAAVISALECGDVAKARQLMDQVVTVDASTIAPGEWTRLRDVSQWPDPWLIAAVRRDPPDEAMLDELVERHWKPLFGRCQMLTLNHQRASDLAQEAWCRVLRARRSLKPDGNFPAYLATIATNLWRDLQRSARRAGPMAEHRMASLDAPFSGDDGDSVGLADVLPDLNSLQAEEQALLKLDIDQALERLNPLLREVLVARFLTGESAAEIGRRYGRTEQTISAWVREAIREMKSHLAELNQGSAPKVEA